MVKRFVPLLVMLAVSSAAVGYLASKIVRYQRIEQSRMIEDELISKVVPRKSGLPDRDHLRPKTDTGGRETVEIESDDTQPEEERVPLRRTEEPAPEIDEEELRILPPGRVAGDDPDRAQLAAAVVLPELAPELQSLGLKSGSAIFIRIFKAERELELWVFYHGVNRYRLFKTYRVAGMSGRLGPKLAEGDLQAPEGFYYVNRRRMNPLSAYHLSFDLGYPNAYDRSHGRTGSFLMVHGSTASVGCFAMTDHGVEEIYSLADAALSGGQEFFRVHVFPFRMSEEAMAKAQGHRWFGFWENLREGYLHFERSGIPPEVSVANKRYVFSDSAR